MSLRFSTSVKRDKERRKWWRPLAAAELSDKAGAEAEATNRRRAAAARRRWRSPR